MKVTELPVEILVSEATILIVGVTIGFTVMVKVLEVTVDGLAQGELEVMTTVITSLLDKLLAKKVELVAPAIGTPFLIH